MTFSLPSYIFRLLLHKTMWRKKWRPNAASTAFFLSDRIWKNPATHTVAACAIRTVLLMQLVFRGEWHWGHGKFLKTSVSVTSPLWRRICSCLPLASWFFEPLVTNLSLLSSGETDRNPWSLLSLTSSVTQRGKCGFYFRPFAALCTVPCIHSPIHPPYLLGGDPGSLPPWPPAFHHGNETGKHHSGC